LSWTHAYYGRGLGVVSTQSYNPEYYWGFLLTLGWKFSKATALTFNEYATIELTKSDTTTTTQQLVFFNPTLDLSHKLTYELRPKQELAIKGAIGAIFPTSPRTQSSTFVVGTNNFGARGRIGATYKWEEIFHGLEVGPTFGYQYRFNSANTIPVERPFNCVLT